MSDFSVGDIFFIVFILGVIHGIMAAIGWARQRKARRAGKTDPG